MEVNESAVVEWKQSLKNVEIAQFLSWSEERKVQALSRISVILSNLWDSENEDLDPYLSFVLKVLETEWENSKIYTLCLFCLKWSKNVEKYRSRVISSISSTINSQLSSCATKFEEAEKILGFASGICTVLHSIVADQILEPFEVDNISSLIKNYLKYLHSTISTIFSATNTSYSSSMVQCIHDVNLHSRCWRQLLSVLHCTVLGSLLPIAFENIALLNQLVSTKKSLLHEESEIIFHYWRMVKIIFSSLAVRENQCDNIAIANGTLAEDVQIDPIVVSTETEKKDVFMKLLVPKENIGVLLPSLAKLLKSAHWLSSIAYADLITTLLQFPLWYQPSSSLKLLLRVMHHFLVLSHVSGTLSSIGSVVFTSEDVSQCHLSSAALEYRVVSSALLWLICSLPRDAKSILNSVSVAVPSKSSTSTSSSASKVHSRAVSPAVLFLNGTTVGTTSIASISTPRTPSTSHISSSDQVQITLQDMMELSSSLLFSLSPDSAIKDITIEQWCFAIHCWYVQFVHQAEEKLQLFSLSEQLEYREYYNRQFEIMRKSEVSHFFASEFVYFPRSAANTRTCHHLRYRHHLREGLFSFKRIFSREDILLKTDITHSSSHYLKQLEGTLENCDCFLRNISQFFNSSDSCNANTAELYQQVLEEAMESIGHLWSMQVYAMTLTLFQELSIVHVSSKQASRPQPTADKQSDQQSVSPAEFKTFRHHNTEVVPQSQNLTSSQPPMSSLFSQPWYQSTQLESLSGRACASQMQGSQSHPHVFRTMTLFQKEYSSEKSESMDTSKNGIAEGTDEACEQLVLAAAHPLAISITRTFVIIVMKALAIVSSLRADLSSSTNSWIKNIVVEKFLEPVVETIWWFFHRTSGFGLEMDELCAEAELDKRVMKDVIDILQSVTSYDKESDGSRKVSVDWNTIFPTDTNAVMDWIFGITCSFHLLRPGDHSGILSTESARLTNALKKSMNSLTDAGLLPSLFTTMSRLLKSLVLFPSQSAHHAQNWSMSVCLQDDTYSDESCLSSAGLLCYLVQFVKYALFKMSSMVAPSLTEQYTPELMTNMTAGLRDIFCCVFILQQTPILLDFQKSDASILKSANVNDELYMQQISLLAAENLFRLWLMLEDLLYRHQYTLLFQQRIQESSPARHESAKQRHIAIESEYDRNILWPEVQNWVSRHQVCWSLLPHDSADIGSIDASVKSLIVKRLLYRLGALLRLYQLVWQQDEQKQAASRIVVPLCQYLLGQFCGICISLVQNASLEYTDPDMIELGLRDLAAAVCSFPRSVLSQGESYHLHCQHHVYITKYARNMEEYPSTSQHCNIISLEQDELFWQQLCVTLSISRVVFTQYNLHLQQQPKEITNSKMQNNLWLAVRAAIIELDHPNEPDLLEKNRFCSMSIPHLLSVLDSIDTDSMKDPTNAQSKLEDQLLLVHSWWNNQHSSPNHLVLSLLSDSNALLPLMQAVKLVLLFVSRSLAGDEEYDKENGLALDKSDSPRVQPEVAADLSMLTDNTCDQHLNKSGMEVDELKEIVISPVISPSIPLSLHDVGPTSTAAQVAKETVLPLPLHLAVAIKQAEDVNFYCIGTADVEPDTLHESSPSTPVGSRKTNDDDEDKDRTTDTEPVKRGLLLENQYKEIAEATQAAVVTGERLSFTDEDILMTGLGTKPANHHSLKASRQDEACSIEVDAKVILFQKRKRDSEDCDSATKQHLIDISDDTAMQMNSEVDDRLDSKRRKISLAAANHLLFNAESALVELQTNFGVVKSMLSQSASSSEKSPQQRLQSLHELLQTSHSLSQTFHALIMQQQAVASEPMHSMKENGVLQVFSPLSNS
jgi:hypothetical protein